MAVVAINRMRIPGNWKEGYALDYHTVSSQFLGHDQFGHAMFETKRSEIGELLYKLKYRSDQSAIESIVETAANFATAFIKARNLSLDFIIPVPPSRERAFQPVLELAKHLSVALNIPLLNDCISKIKDTPELKDVYNYEDRTKLLEGAYTVALDSMEGKNILLFDDLYRSGATLNAITSILYSTGKAANVYVLALTRTRSAS
jgi:competence protein ComFC